VDTGDDTAQLSLSLNGAPSLQTEVESPLGNGVVSLQAWTFPIHEQPDVGPQIVSPDAAAPIDLDGPATHQRQSPHRRTPSAP